MSSQRLRDPTHPASLCKLSTHSPTLVHSLKNKVRPEFFRKSPPVYRYEKALTRYRPHCRQGHLCDPNRRCHPLSTFHTQMGRLHRSLCQLVGGTQDCQPGGGGSARAARVYQGPSGPKQCPNAHPLCHPALPREAEGETACRGNG